MSQPRIVIPRQMESNLRIYGPAPYRAAVIHGGPGAPGEMASVARELAARCGVLEPLQTRDSIQGQVEELRAIVQQHGQPPITLVGHSWGAMLSFIFAAQHPALVKKLILVGSGVFEDRYAPAIMETRLSRLSEAQRAQLEALSLVLQDPTSPEREAAFAQFGKLFDGTDTYKPLPHQEDDVTTFQPALYESVWNEAQELRTSGKLLALGKQICCPVVAIHGDYDPHPAEGISVPLASVLKDFRFILLEHCGHTPGMNRKPESHSTRCSNKSYNESDSCPLLNSREDAPDGLSVQRLPESH
jgi:pimeloyl-ACP methyl ester carboxylesterase